jgi:hypothetical protein
MPITPDELWRRIIANTGQWFQTIRGMNFVYVVANGAVHTSRTNHQLSRSQFEKALARVPLNNTSVVQDLRGPSYIYAILMDERVRANDW